MSRFVRMLRLMKVARHSENITLVMESLAASYHGLLTLFSFLTLGCVISGTLAYAAESEAGHPGAFVSIPAAMWWSMTTITTVGYGDMVPMTVPGKVVGCLTMVGGTLIVSVSVAMITSSFTEQYRQRSEKAKLEKAMRVTRMRTATGDSQDLDRTPQVRDGGEPDLMMLIGTL